MAKSRRLEQARLARYYERDRSAALAAYGGRCLCCGEDNPVFLAIDHPGGGGEQHRKIIGENIARWLRKNGYPAGFRVLCHNCNWAEHRGGCPHGNLAPAGAAPGAGWAHNPAGEVRLLDPRLFDA